MKYGLNLRPAAALDFVSLGALIHRLDPAGPRDANTFDTAGHYVHGLRRTPQGWRIDRIEQRVLWSRGEPRVHGALRGPER